jgi:hypothetical protein
MYEADGTRAARQLRRLNAHARDGEPVRFDEVAVSHAQDAKRRQHQRAALQPDLPVGGRADATHAPQNDAYDRQRRNQIDGGDGT